MKSLVTKYPKASVAPMLRDRPTLRRGAEQWPTLMPETAKRVSAATARSHIDTSWRPAAVAMPVHPRDHRLGQFG